MKFLPKKGDNSVPPTLLSCYLSFILFADDTNIFFQHKNICELTEIVNRELSLVASWFKA